MRIDLHMHSTYSDGVHTPAHLLDLAEEQGLAAVSLTDHDCLDGVSEAIEAGRKKSIEVISGVELSCEFDDRDLHILGYGMDHEDADFRAMLTMFCETRYKRGLKIVEKLNALGIHIEPAEVLAKAGKGALGRPHIAAVLLDKGVVSKPAEAFDKYLAEGGPAYVPKYKMSPDDAVEHIHRAGGLAFIAHPGVFLDSAEELETLLDHGFDGVEIYHPSHGKERVRMLEAVAEQRGLLASGGTDFHGFKGRDIPLGAMNVSYDVWTKMKEKLDGKGTSA